MIRLFRDKTGHTGHAGRVLHRKNAVDLLRAVVPIVLLMACILLPPPSAGILDFLPEGVYQSSDRCIQSIYAGDFRQAEQEAKKIIKDHPEHPAGYFFSAVVLDVWMEYYQSTEKEEEFYRYCDLAIQKGEVLLDREPQNPWPRFFIGGADGYKGTYESRQGRWITAFRFGWKGVSLLMEIRKDYPDMSDLNYGIGSYNYWRSAMTKKMRWLPGVEDKRGKGIRMLRDAKENGLFTRMPAAAALVPILINEKRYEEALELTGEMIEQFPRSLVFYWGKGEAQFGLRRFAEAEETFRYILGRVESEPYDNHYNAVVCHYWLSRIALETRRYTQAIAACNRMNYYKLSKDVKRRLKKYFEEAEQIRKQARAARTRLNQPQLMP